VNYSNHCAEARVRIGHLQPVPALCWNDPEHHARTCFRCELRFAPSQPLHEPCRASLQHLFHTSCSLCTAVIIDGKCFRWSRFLGTWLYGAKYRVDVGGSWLGVIGTVVGLGILRSMLCVYDVCLPPEHIHMNTKQRKPILKELWFWSAINASGTFLYFCSTPLASVGTSCSVLDPGEVKKQDFYGILYQSFQVASLTPTSKHSKKSAETPS